MLNTPNQELSPSQTKVPHKMFNDKELLSSQLLHFHLDSICFNLPYTVYFNTFLQCTGNWLAIIPKMSQHHLLMIDLIALTWDDIFDGGSIRGEQVSWSHRSSFSHLFSLSARYLTNACSTCCLNKFIITCTFILSYSGFRLSLILCDFYLKTCVLLLRQNW